MILTNKTIHFGRLVLDDIKCFTSDIYFPFRKVVIQSIETMLLQSIGTNDTYFRPDYCTEMEKFSPVAFTYFK